MTLDPGQWTEGLRTAQDGSDPREQAARVFHLEWQPGQKGRGILWGDKLFTWTSGQHHGPMRRELGWPDYDAFLSIGRDGHFAVVDTGSQLRPEPHEWEAGKGWASDDVRKDFAQRLDQHETEMGQQAMQLDPRLKHDNRWEFTGRTADYPTIDPMLRDQALDSPPSWQFQVHENPTVQCNVCGWQGQEAEARHQCPQCSSFNSMEALSAPGPASAISDTDDQSHDTSQHRERLTFKQASDDDLPMSYPFTGDGWVMPSQSQHRPVIEHNGERWVGEPGEYHPRLVRRLGLPDDVANNARHGIIEPDGEEMWYDEPHWVFGPQQPEPVDPSAQLAVEMDKNGPESVLGENWKTAGETLPQEQRRWQQLRSQEGYTPSSEVVHATPDGWTVQKHRSYGDAGTVGQMMRNCWAGIYGQAPNGDVNADQNMYNPGGPSYERHALHDPHGIPRVAFFIAHRDGKPVMIDPLGRSNNAPSAEHLDKLWDYSQAHGIYHMPRIGDYEPMTQDALWAMGGRYNELQRGVPATLGQPVPAGGMRQSAVPPTFHHHDPRQYGIADMSQFSESIGGRPTQEYEDRIPILYYEPTHSVHVGPTNYGHGDVMEAARLEGHALEYGQELHQGWVGQNPEGDGLYGWYNDEGMIPEDVDNAVRQHFQAQGRVPSDQWTFKSNYEGDFFHWAPASERTRIQQHGLMPAAPMPGSTNWNPTRDQGQPSGIYVLPEDAAKHERTELMLGQFYTPMDLYRIPRDQVQQVHPDPRAQGAYYVPHPVSQPMLEKPFEQSDASGLHFMQTPWDKYAAWTFTAAGPPLIIEHSDADMRQLGAVPLSEDAWGGVGTEYQQRRPLIYNPDLHMVHVGPPDYAHTDVGRAMMAKGYEYGHGNQAEGWIGFNPEAEDRDLHDGIDGGKAGDLEYGWYSYRQQPPQDVHDAIHDYFGAQQQPEDTWTFTQPAERRTQPGTQGITAHTLAWQPGEMGKALYMRDGTIHSWPASYTPAHQDYMHRNGLSRYDAVGYYDVTPDGRVLGLNNDPHADEVAQAVGGSAIPQNTWTFTTRTSAQIIEHDTGGLLKSDAQPYVVDLSGTVHVGSPGAAHIDVLNKVFEGKERVPTGNWPMGIVHHAGDKIMSLYGPRHVEAEQALANYYGLQVQPPDTWTFTAVIHGHPVVYSETTGEVRIGPEGGDHGNTSKGMVSPFHFGVWEGEGGVFYWLGGTVSKGPGPEATQAVADAVGPDFREYEGWTFKQAAVPQELMMAAWEAFSEWSQKGVDWDTAWREMYYILHERFPQVTELEIEQALNNAARMVAEGGHDLPPQWKAEMGEMTPQEWQQDYALPEETRRQLGPPRFGADMICKLCQQQIDPSQHSIVEMPNGDQYHEHCADTYGAERLWDQTYNVRSDRGYADQSQTYPEDWHFDEGQEGYIDPTGWDFTRPRYGAATISPMAQLAPHRWDHDDGDDYLCPQCKAHVGAHPTAAYDPARDADHRDSTDSRPTFRETRQQLALIPEPSTRQLPSHNPLHPPATTTAAHAELRKFMARISTEPDRSPSWDMSRSSVDHPERPQEAHRGPAAEKVTSHPGLNDQGLREPYSGSGRLLSPLALKHERMNSSAWRRAGESVARHVAQTRPSNKEFLGCKSTEEGRQRLGWNFGNGLVKSSGDTGHALRWAPGDWGKGLIRANGEIHTWPTEGHDGWPWHSQYEKEYGITDSLAHVEMMPNGEALDLSGNDEAASKFSEIEPRAQFSRGWTFRSNQESQESRWNWTPGQRAKGVLTPDGILYGFPANVHGEVYDRFDLNNGVLGAEPDEYTTDLDVNPNGTYVLYSNRAIADEDTLHEMIQRNDPRLRPVENKWNFTGADQESQGAPSPPAQTPPGFVPWTKGQPGKGTYVDGTPYLWADQDMPEGFLRPDDPLHIEPHHADAALAIRPDAIADRFLYVTPQGGVESYGERPREDASEFAKSHPELFSQWDTVDPNSWVFKGASEPQIGPYGIPEPPTPDFDAQFTPNASALGLKDGTWRVWETYHPTEGGAHAVYMLKHGIHPSQVESYWGGDRNGWVLYNHMRDDYQAIYDQLAGMNQYRFTDPKTSAWPGWNFGPRTPTRPDQQQTDDGRAMAQAIVNAADGLRRQGLEVPQELAQAEQTARRMLQTEWHFGAVVEMPATGWIQKEPPNSRPFIAHPNGQVYVGYWGDFHEDIRQHETYPRGDMNRHEGTIDRDGNIHWYVGRDNEAEQQLRQHYGLQGEALSDVWTFGASKMSAETDPNVQWYRWDNDENIAKLHHEGQWEGDHSFVYQPSTDTLHIGHPAVDHDPIHQAAGLGWGSADAQPGWVFNSDERGGAPSFQLETSDEQNRQRIFNYMQGLQSKAGLDLIEDGKDVWHFTGADENKGFGVGDRVISNLDWHKVPGTIIKPGQFDNHWVIQKDHGGTLEAHEKFFDRLYEDQLLQHPDPMMDNEPGTTTFPPQWNFLGAVGNRQSDREDNHRNALEEPALERPVDDISGPEGNDDGDSVNPEISSVENDHGLDTSSLPTPPDPDRDYGGLKTKDGEFYMFESPEETHQMYMDRAGIEWSDVKALYGWSSNSQRWIDYAKDVWTFTAGLPRTYVYDALRPNERYTDRRPVVYYPNTDELHIGGRGDEHTMIYQQHDPDYNRDDETWNGSYGYAGPNRGDIAGVPAGLYWYDNDDPTHDGRILQAMKENLPDYDEAEVIPSNVWTFDKTAGMEWSGLGTWGKGFLDADGKLHTWNDQSVGYKPGDDWKWQKDWAHAQYATNRGLVAQPGSEFYVSPDGEIGSMVQDADIYRAIKERDPRLWSRKHEQGLPDQWQFRYEQPT
jgi:hypothetical protein